MTGISAKIIEDSIWRGNRLTTLLCRYHRFIHPQVLTHCVFSRNSASSRAIPTGKLLKQEIAFPTKFGINRSGMSAQEYLSGDKLEECISDWEKCHEDMVWWVNHFQSKYNLHKQTVNRLLEPFLYIETLITTTEWDNFFALRIDDAQPEMMALARAIHSARSESSPVERSVHMPFGGEEKDPKLAIARCARLSYLNHFGEYSLESDYAIYNKLLNSGHMSPFEHVATAADNEVDSERYFFKLKGWKSQRWSLENAR